MRRGTAPVVVLTGFGTFPGVTRNASANLVERLAARARQEFSGYRFALDILPVDWTEAPRRLERLMQAWRPIVAVHFGVSSRASGFVIERHAHNESHEALDIRGDTRGAGPLVPGDRMRRTSTLPTRAILHSLQRAGLPVALSNDPGRYLCNAVMYHSLRHARTVTPCIRSGFIHIPATLDATQEGVPSLLDPASALEGGMRIIDTCLTPLHPAEPTLS